MNEISGIPTSAIPAAGEGAGKEAARTADDLKKERQLKKACRDFEAVFTYYMLKTTRKTIPSGGVIGKVTGQDTYDMLMDQKIAEEASSRAKGLGLQKILFEQLNRGPQK